MIPLLTGLPVIDHDTKRKLKRLSKNPSKMWLLMSQLSDKMARKRLGFQLEASKSTVLCMVLARKTNQLALEANITSKEVKKSESNVLRRALGKEQAKVATKRAINIMT